MALGLIQPLTEMSTRNISWRVKAAGAYGWQHTTFMCRLSSNLGASTSWNPQGLSRPVMGLLFILIYGTVRWVLLCLFTCSNKSHEDGGIQLFLWKRNSYNNDTQSVIFGKRGSWQLWFTSDISYSQCAAAAADYNNVSCIPRTIIIYTLPPLSLISSILSRSLEHSKCHCSSKENEDKETCKIFWFNHEQKYFWANCTCQMLPSVWMHSEFLRRIMVIGGDMLHDSCAKI